MPIPVNIQNFAVGFGLYFGFVHFHVVEWASILIVLILQALWAVKDGLVPYEKYNEGSTKDQ